MMAYVTNHYSLSVCQWMQVFSFDPAAMVQAPGHQSGKTEEDMTKLCNHRRKVDAMAALCQSMQPPQLTPTGLYFNLHYYSNTILCYYRNDLCLSLVAVCSKWLTFILVFKHSFSFQLKRREQNVCLW